ncbi:MAG: hypothetical protein ABIH49_03520 [archaeon]
MTESKRTLRDIVGRLVEVHMELHRIAANPESFSGPRDDESGAILQYQKNRYLSVLRTSLQEERHQLFDEINEYQQIFDAATNQSPDDFAPPYLN